MPKTEGNLFCGKCIIFIVKNLKPMDENLSVGESMAELDMEDDRAVEYQQ